MPPQELLELTLSCLEEALDQGEPQTVKSLLGALIDRVWQMPPGSAVEPMPSLWSSSPSCSFSASRLTSAWLRSMAKR